MLLTVSNPITILSFAAMFAAITASFQGEERKLTYKGKITGDTIKLSSDFGGNGQTIEWTLKKS